MPLVLCGVIAALIFLPKLVRERLAARIEARTGLAAQVEGVSLGLTSVEVERIAVGADAQGPVVRVQAIEVDASPLMLALRGSKAVDGVHVERVEIDLPLHAQRTEELLARLRSRADGGAERAAAGDEEQGLEAAVDHVSVTVRDAQGELLRGEGRVKASGASAELHVAKLRIGSAPSHVLELERVAVQAKRGKQGIRLARVQVGAARAALARPTAPEPQPTAADSNGAPDKKQARAVPAAAPAPTQPEPAAAPEPPPGTWSRLLRLGDALARARGGGREQDAKRAAQPKASERGAVLDRLADGASFTLESASVHVGGFDEKPILKSLRATTKLQKDRALSLSGDGKAASGGSVAWDLVLRPEQLQADGRIALRSMPLDLIAPFLPNVPWYEPEHGRVDAELVVKTESAQVIALSGEAALRDAAIAAARIAPAPVRNIGFVVRGQGKFMPLAHRLEIGSAELARGDAAVELTGAVEWSPEHYLFDIEAVLPPTPCTDAVRVIPEDLLGEMALATWVGKLGGKLRLKLDSRALDDTELDIDVNDRCEFATVPIMADLRRFQVPFVHSVLEPNGQLFEMETGPGTPAWTYLEDISPFFVHAVIAHEDGRFFSHKGFSLNHIRNALVRNLKEGRYVVGASTITMQLVKNVFLHREKTLARKIQEVLLTWWIERVMDKRDILELYLNVIEYGPGVYGIRHGARHYFNRLPSQLSPAEGVYLSTILPNPKRYHSHFERGALSPQWVEIMRRMLLRLRERGSYSPEAVEYGLAEIKAFKFVPEGSIVPARIIQGTAAPLPYMQGFTDDPGWDEDLGATPFEFEDEPLPARVDPGAARP